MEEMIMEGSLLTEIMKMAMKTSEKQIPLGSHWEFCYSILLGDVQKLVFGKTSKIPTMLGTDSHSKYYFAMKRYLGHDKLLDAFCILYCMSRAIDTIEDDPTIPSEIKVPILEDFHRHIYDRNLPISCGDKHYKVLMDQYHHISTALMDLPKGCQNSIQNAMKIMGAAMAKFILNEVQTVDDYTEYVCNVTGVVFLEMSKIMHALNLEDLISDHLPSSIGILAEKLHMITDFYDDMIEIPRGRIYWPSQIWSKYVDKIEDLIYKENSEKALCCLNDMVTDALSHAVDSLEYLSTLRHCGTFQCYAILQVSAIGTLSLCYNNTEVFRGGVRMSRVSLKRADVHDLAMAGVYQAVYDFSSTLKMK
ncbi:squalene synthase-like, partial [Papaver somniferum]|uniref:squalene synthase-like n=1 Tax=Papaver somniferum TaxID=3469 RepID=UPI000E6FC5BB